jgi:hypothetical protein
MEVAHSLALRHQVAGGTESLVVSLDIAVLLKVTLLLVFIVCLRERLEEAGSRVCRLLVLWSASILAQTWSLIAMQSYQEMVRYPSLEFDGGHRRVSLSPEITPWRLKCPSIARRFP